MKINKTTFSNFIILFLIVNQVTAGTKQQNSSNNQYGNGYSREYNPQNNRTNQRYYNNQQQNNYNNNSNYPSNNNPQNTYNRNNNGSNSRVNDGLAPSADDRKYNNYGQYNRPNIPSTNNPNNTPRGTYNNGPNSPVNTRVGLSARGPQYNNNNGIAQSPHIQSQNYNGGTNYPNNTQDHRIHGPHNGTDKNQQPNDNDQQSEKNKMEKVLEYIQENKGKVFIGGSIGIAVTFVLVKTISDALNENDSNLSSNHQSNNPSNPLIKNTKSNEYSDSNSSSSSSYSSSPNGSLSYNPYKYSSSEDSNSQHLNSSSSNYNSNHNSFKPESSNQNPYYNPLPTYNPDPSYSPSPIVKNKDEQLLEQAKQDLNADVSKILDFCRKSESSKLDYLKNQLKNKFILYKIDLLSSSFSITQILPHNEIFDSSYVLNITEIRKLKLDNLSKIKDIIKESLLIIQYLEKYYDMYKKTFSTFVNLGPQRLTSEFSKALKEYINLYLKNKGSNIEVTYLSDIGMNFKKSSITILDYTKIPGFGNTMTFLLSPEDANDLTHVFEKINECFAQNFLQYSEADWSAFFINSINKDIEKLKQDAVIKEIISSPIYKNPYMRRNLIKVMGSIGCTLEDNPESLIMKKQLTGHIICNESGLQNRDSNSIETIDILKFTIDRIKNIFDLYETNKLLFFRSISNDLTFKKLFANSAARSFNKQNSDIKIEIKEDIHNPNDYLFIIQEKGTDIINISEQKVPTWDNLEMIFYDGFFDDLAKIKNILESVIQCFSQFLKTLK